MHDCIYCKIVRRELPAEILHDDDDVCAFLERNPINPGHAIVVPKTHFNSLTQIPEDLMGRLFSVATSLAQSIVRVTDSDAFNLHVANGECIGEVIPHSHVHVIPRVSTDGFAWGWRSLSCSETDRNELAQEIRAHNEKKKR
jgi:histidine triad (HIT) family protein